MGRQTKSAKFHIHLFTGKVFRSRSRVWAPTVLTVRFKTGRSERNIMRPPPLCCISHASSAARFPVVSLPCWVFRQDFDSTQSFPLLWQKWAMFICWAIISQCLTCSITWPHSKEGSRAIVPFPFVPLRWPCSIQSWVLMSDSALAEDQDNLGVGRGATTFRPLALSELCSDGGGGQSIRARKTAPWVMAPHYVHLKEREGGRETELVQSS